MKHAYRTDKGLRQVNQDCVWVVSSIENPSAFDVERYGSLFAVADGVGGHQAGEVASQMACEGLAHYFDTSRETSVESHLAALQSVFTEINRAVFRKSVSADEFFMMGTTLSVLVIVGATALIAHVGDSRIYRLREATWELLTYDHTEVQRLVDSGELSLEQAKTYPRKQWLTEAIGAEPELETLYSRIESVISGDRYLLCTDGLSNFMSDVQLNEIVRASVSPEKACEELIRIALTAGSEDNLTAFVLYY